MSFLFSLFLLALPFITFSVMYREAVSFKNKNGAWPWSISALVWGLIGFFSLIVGVVLLLIATKTTKPLAGYKNLDQMGYTSSGAMNPYAGQNFQPVLAQWSGAGPNWYADPSRKHQLRYFDGVRWTENVSDNGFQSIDAIN